MAEDQSRGRGRGEDEALAQRLAAEQADRADLERQAHEIQARQRRDRRVGDALFDSLDKNHDGVLTANELRPLAGQLTAADMSAGAMTREEFHLALQRAAERLRHLEIQAEDEQAALVAKRRADDKDKEDREKEQRAAAEREEQRRRREEREDRAFWGTLFGAAAAAPGAAALAEAALLGEVMAGGTAPGRPPLGTFEERLAAARRRPRDDEQEIL